MTDLDLIESRLREYFDEYGEALPAIARVRAHVAELEAENRRLEAERIYYLMPKI